MLDPVLSQKTRRATRLRAVEARGHAGRELVSVRWLLRRQELGVAARRGRDLAEVAAVVSEDLLQVVQKRLLRRRTAFLDFGLLQRATLGLEDIHGGCGRGGHDVESRDEESVLGKRLSKDVTFEQLVEQTVHTVCAEGDERGRRLKVADTNDR